MECKKCKTIIKELDYETFIFTEGCYYDNQYDHKNYGEWKDLKFFCKCGEFITSNPDIAREIVQEGRKELKEW